LKIEILTFIDTTDSGWIRTKINEYKYADEAQWKKLTFIVWQIFFRQLNSPFQLKSDLFYANNIKIAPDLAIKTYKAHAILSVFMQ
jgi:hypothetical protein